jgi:imidazolonepropionase-like amidohydrolase
MKKLLTAVILALSITSCNKQQDTANPESKDQSSGNSTAVMYYNGDIITMEGEQSQYEEALLVKDGKILFTGKKDEAMKKAGAGHKMVDLKGNTLVPGFIIPG